MRFVLFDPPILTTRVIALVLAAAVIAVGLYWRGERRVSGRTRFALACLRMVTLLLVGAILLNPVAIRSAAGGQKKASFLLLVDVSRSMRVRDAGGQSRFAAAKQAVLNNRSLIETLSALWDVRVYAFSERGARATLQQVQGVTRPDGQRTEIGDAVMNVASEANQGDDRSAGALLVSDGRDNGDTSPLAAAKVARGAGLPIWTLCLGKQGSSKDIAVLTYANQNFAFARQRATLSADIEQKGYGASTLTATLARDGVPVAQQPVSFSDDGRQTVRLPVTEANPGLYRYTISVAPRRDEINARNNSGSVYLRVTNDRLKVLLMDARPSWDTKFLSQALRQDPNVNFTGIYHLSSARDFSVTTAASNPGKPPAPAGDASGQPRAPKIRLPRRAEELFPYDVVILGKGFEDLLTDTGVDLLKRYLLERGGSVVFCRGKPDTGSERLRDIEPVIWGGDEVRNLQLSLTEDGRQSPVFAFPTREEPQTILRKLPHLISATRVQGEKSFAVVLARGIGGEGSGQPMAAVAYQRYGAGRVMVIAGQGLWQWSFLPDSLAPYEVVYRSFWTQMLQWLVSGSDFLPGRDISLKTDRMSYVPGQRVHLLVFSKQGRQLRTPLRLEVVDPDGQRASVTPGRSQAFGATAVGLYTPRQTGDYKVVLRTGPRESDKLEASFSVYESREEDQMTEADPQLMRQIAEVSGGGVVTPAATGELVRQVKDVEKRTLLRERPTPIWDRWWVFVTLCALLGTEWHLRRKRGMC